MAAKSRARRSFRELAGGGGERIELRLRGGAGARAYRPTEHGSPPAVGGGKEITLREGVRLPRGGGGREAATTPAGALARRRRPSPAVGGRRQRSREREEGWERLVGKEGVN